MGDVYYECPVHGNIGKVSVGCGGKFSELADITYIGGKKVCTKCLAELIEKNLPRLAVKSDGK